jgi:YVTN family beta-propeller protein
MRSKLVLPLGLAAAAFILPAQSAPSGYHILKTVKLGGEGGWDYLSIDPAARHIFIAHGTHVVVADADSGAIVADIPDTPGVHGLAVAPDANRGYVSDGTSNSADIVDLKTLKKIGNVAVGQRPDGITYDPASKRVFTYNSSHDATAIDAATGKVVGTVMLGGKPEFSTYDGKGTGFVNIEDKSEVIAFDTNTLAVKAHWPLAPCEEPSGMALDAAHNRLFSVCGNSLMAVLDTTNGKLITSIKIGDGADAARYDAGTGLVFASSGDGKLTIVHEDSPAKFTALDTVDTAAGARTMEIDPKTHNVYTVTADREAAPAPTPDGQRPRPRLVPDSFKLIILGK